MINPDGKLVEPQDPSPITEKDIVDRIMNGQPASVTLKQPFRGSFSSLQFSLPSASGFNGLASLTFSRDGTAVISHASPYYGRHLSSCTPSSPSGTAAGVIIPTLTRNGEGGRTVTTRHDISATPFICSAAKIMILTLSSPSCSNLPMPNAMTVKISAIDDFRRNCFGLSPKNICLNSVHDNIPTYELLEHWGIDALIDINGRAKSSN